MLTRICFRQQFVQQLLAFTLFQLCLFESIRGGRPRLNSTVHIVLANVGPGSGGVVGWADESDISGIHADIRFPCHPPRFRRETVFVQPFRNNGERLWNGADCY
jgi:hypothetical protein